VTREMHLGHILLPEGGVQDCTHYCSPGVPEVRRLAFVNGIALLCVMIVCVQGSAVSSWGF
jgi:hypothetical protein